MAFCGTCPLRNARTEIDLILRFDKTRTTVQRMALNCAKVLFELEHENTNDNNEYTCPGEPTIRYSGSEDDQVLVITCAHLGLAGIVDYLVHMGTGFPAYEVVLDIPDMLEGE